MTSSQIETLIGDALRTPEQFTPRQSIQEPAVVWQARAVRVALTNAGVIQP